MRTTIDSYTARSGRLNLEGIEFDDFNAALESRRLRRLSCVAGDDERDTQRDERR